jgi:hypothetical protein
MPTAVKTARKAAAAAIQRLCQRRTRATASSALDKEVRVEFTRTR